MWIGITGKKQHGKTTLADVFVQSGYRPINFADPLHAFSRFVLGEAPTSSNKEIVHPVVGFSHRQIMTKLGTEFARRELHPDFWLRVFMNRARDEKNVVIADVRFENEAEMIRANGGVIVHVHRPGYKPPPSSTDAHVSEAGIKKDPSDYVLINKGTFADYLSECWSMADRILQP